jgi:hypothetical protein
MRALTVALFFLSISFSVSAQNYPLEVEAHQVHSSTEGLASLDGLTTYRIYVTNLGANDFVSSVYGNNTSPFELSVPDGIYNSAFNTGWSAAGISPLFISSVPELEYDSYATIGLTQSASTSGISGAADPSLVEDPTQQFSPMFLSDGSVGGMVNSVTGFAYYILNDGTNTAGLPDVNGRVMIMQITTCGSLSGTLNVQIFPNGVDAEFDLYTYNFDGDTSPLGCTFSFACNYDPEATIDDGSCDFVDTDGDGICDASEIPGCTDLSACNYEMTATDDDGSCDFVDTDEDGVCDLNEITGCTDPTACNYEMLATDDDGTCTYASTYDCSGECVNDNDGDGVCDELEILGCTDQGSCNFDLQATDDDDSSCEYVTCAGCQYEFACNYDPEATIADNDSCEFGTCPGCTDSAACNYNPTVSEDDGSCVYPDFGSDCDGNCMLYLDENGTVNINEWDPEALCGNGTYWDSESGHCVVTYPSDSNFDSCVDLNDLLALLQSYGACIIAVCGNGIHEYGEECDDGNDIPGDGCDGCTVEYCSNTTISFDSWLSGGQTASQNTFLTGTLTQVQFNLNFTSSGGEWPSDMIVVITGANGNCMAGEGYNIYPPSSCYEINFPWPNTTANGLYTYTMSAAAAGISGDGTWFFDLQNGWNFSGSNAHYDLDIILFGVCGTNLCETGVLCGEGTYWDSELSQCVIPDPSDSNWDGCVDLNDLLALLQNYGICIEPE